MVVAENIKVHRGIIIVTTARISYKITGSSIPRRRLGSLSLKRRQCDEAYCHEEIFVPDYRNRIEYLSLNINVYVCLSE